MKQISNQANATNEAKHKPALKLKKPNVSGNPSELIDESSDNLSVQRVNETTWETKDNVSNEIVEDAKDNVLLEETDKFLPLEEMKQIFTEESPEGIDNTNTTKKLLAILTRQVLAVVRQNKELVRQNKEILRQNKELLTEIKNLRSQQILNVNNTVNNTYNIDLTG
jgi:hypothetical protein